MAPPPSVTELNTDGNVFSPTAKPPGSSTTLFLAGAGVRELEIQGKRVKFTAIAVYVEDEAVASLAGRWKGKDADELAGSVEFFRDIVTGPFEKFTRVKMILPLTGQQYSEKVTENCVAYWKAVGTYTDAEAKAVKEFLDVFKDQNFPPGSSILFTQSPLGCLSISFTKDESFPEAPNTVIKNKQLSEAVLESIIGKHGVSPATKQSIGTRMSELLKEVSACKVAPADSKVQLVEAEKVNGERKGMEDSNVQPVDAENRSSGVRKGMEDSNVQPVDAEKRSNGVRKGMEDSNVQLVDAEKRSNGARKVMEN